MENFEKRCIERFGAFLPKEERELLQDKLNKKEYTNMKLYSIKDVIAEKFLPPQVARNNAEAIRNFSIACTDPNSMLNRRPSDFELWYIGEFDDDAGKILQEEKFVIANAAEFASQTPIGTDVPTTPAKN